MNDEVAESEQRGVLSVGRDVCYTPDFRTQLYKAGIAHACQKMNHEAEEVMQNVSLLMLFFSSRIDDNTINSVQIDPWKIEGHN